MVNMKNCVRNRISTDINLENISSEIDNKKKVVRLFKLVSLMKYLFC
jgi:hypothetical protein